MLIEGNGKCALRKEPVIGCSLNTYFLKVLLINSINTESNLRKGFIFVHLLLEDYEQGVLQKELIIAPLMERFKELFPENPIGNMN